MIHYREIPNIISLLRVLLVAPVVWALLSGWFELALVLFAIAGISDGLDGFLAKRFNWESELGAMLDPMADKVLLVSCYIVLGILHLLPDWIVAAVIFRDVAIVVGAMIYHYKVEELHTTPMMISKLNTFLQIMLVIVVVAAQGVFPLDPVWVEWLIYTVLATTVMSGVSYGVVWGARAHKHYKNLS